MSSPKSRFAGRVVAITGAASGIGRRAAERFAAEGALVYGSDVNVAGLAETEKLITEAAGSFVGRAPVDATDEVQTAAWLDFIGAEHGRIDVLLPSAGIARFSPIEETTLEDWKFVLTHELDIVFVPAKAAWPWLRAASGNIVLLGSSAGVRGSVTNTRIAHTATKAGVIGMAQQFAAEGAAHGIRANSVSPGVIRTPATEGDLLADNHPMRNIAEHIPLKRIGTIDDVVATILFFASDEAGYITGTNLMVDGGWSSVLPG
ncbi:MAG: SDR family oxidoreductase [Actinobacteria bacterium]|uniref:Unannotated protein n=1 Tax=freshwater metagenome TaxID=449393 RepID=A0A6J7FX63_9ZZZZ|nr:SDR family oxidoreductase [Actinomycetota bacterium]